MRCKLLTAALFALLLTGALAHAQSDNRQRLVLNHTDELEVVFENDRYVTYVNGNVEFRTETGLITCDSAVFVRGEFARLRGNVHIDDEEYMLRSDSAYYDIFTNQAIARGSNVVLWSYEDSLYAAGVHAFYDRGREHFYMEDRPVVYLGYPDSASMVEIIADFVDYEKDRERAEAIGNVIITSDDIGARSGCAVMDLDRNLLDLYDEPVATRGRSTLTGGFISIAFDEEVLTSIDVIDSARGEFMEPTDSTETDFDESILSGDRIRLYFQRGQLHRVLATDQAYSWYYPSRRGTSEYHENTVSGDTIRFFVFNESLQQVTVTGGARGTYITGKADPEISRPRDSAQVAKPADTTGATLSESAPSATDIEQEPDSEPADTTFSDTTKTQPEASSARLDTISYRGYHIEYSLVDSMISLSKRSEVQSGTMSLRAHDVEFDTKERMVEAFSAEIDPDQKDIDFYNLANRLQPATIPVILQDGNDELFGDYLEYSIDTEKGRIVQSKSEFEQGYYYGGKLFREKRDVFYVKDGFYTTCDADEPHFHFHSSNMKLMENNKLIARPVVFYIERIPLFALPYYVFPLKRGRHSGILPFTFGRFERGERYVQNLGYYWAASEYWDWRGAVDYYEQRRTLTFKSRVAFAKRYVLDGYIDGEWREQTNYNAAVAQESSPTTFSLKGQYNHQITPSFDIRASGSYVSSATYYTDFSNSLDERLRRELISKANFSKRFGNGISLSGSVQHTENLDLETRSDQLPSLSVSLPTIYPFGASSTNDEGESETRWWNNFTIRYGPSLLNSSSRATVVESVDTTFGDPIIEFDTSGIAVDTIIPVEEVDTVTSRTRKHVATIQHNPSISLPALRWRPYFNITPSFSYRETWYKIFETDQSRAAGIDASETYRTWAYSASVSANTTLYGTLYPNIGGLVGLRHVFKPSVSYSWSPELDRHPAVRSFAGGGAASSKSSRIGFTVQNNFQAKVLRNEIEQNYDLLSMTTSFSYDFENETRPLSQMSTSFFTSTVPRVNISGQMTHTFYDPDTGEENFLSPWLLAFSTDVTFQLSGNVFFFTDPGFQGIPHGADSASQVGDMPQPGSSRRGWNLSVTYNFQETGRHSNFYNKRSFLRTTLGFGLTPSTSVNYSQQYDIGRGEVVSAQVNIMRNLHCWTGSLYWVPIGSNRGFGFKLNVTDLPDIKLESGHDSFISSDVLRRY